MEFDDDGLDEGPVAPLLPPEDRLWRHPSEVATDPHRGSPPRGREPRLLTIVALTSSISVLLTLGVVAVVRPVRSAVATAPVASVDLSANARSDLADVVAITDRLRSSITHVLASGPGGSRRGSAVLYRRDGLLLTAHHLVEGATGVRVRLDDGRTVSATVRGGDPETDIAVLDISGGGFAVAPLGSATALRQGEPAITIGTPADSDDGPVVTVGAIRGVGQSVASSGRHMLDMIQMDAPVASGCAGGAVVDGAGVVIGIATMNASHDGDTSGYATPIDIARAVAHQLVAMGRVDRGWLGIEGETAPDGAGVVVKAVKEASPAAAAGVVAADVITGVEGEPVESMAELLVLLRTRRPGESLTLTLTRGGTVLSVSVTLAEKPAPA